MPTNFTKGQREVLYAKTDWNRLYLNSRSWLKKDEYRFNYKKSQYYNRDFLSFFDSKEAFVQALIDYQD